MIRSTDAQVAHQGQQASDVLANEAYIAAMAMLKASINEMWRSTNLRDKEGQTLALQMAQVADRFEGIMSGLVQAGVMASKKLDMNDLRDETATRRFFRKVSG